MTDLKATIRAKLAEPVEGGIAIEPWYEKEILRIESIEKNRDGSDKSWLFHSLKVSEEHFRRAKPK